MLGAVFGSLKVEKNLFFLQTVADIRVNSLVTDLLRYRVITRKGGVFFFQFHATPQLQWYMCEMLTLLMFILLQTRV